MCLKNQEKKKDYLILVEKSFALSLINLSLNIFFMFKIQHRIDRRKFLSLHRMNELQLHNLKSRSYSEFFPLSYKLHIPSIASHEKRVWKFRISLLSWFNIISMSLHWIQFQSSLRCKTKNFFFSSYLFRIFLVHIWIWKFANFLFFGWKIEIFFSSFDFVNNFFFSLWSSLQVV